MKALHIISTPKYYLNWEYLLLLLAYVHHFLLAVGFAAFPALYLYYLYYRSKASTKNGVGMGLNP